MTFRFLVIFLCLRLVWLKERLENPDGADNSHKDFFGDEVESGRHRGTQRFQGFESVEGHADDTLGGWGYEVVQGTNKPFSYVRTTTSDSSKRLMQAAVTRVRAPLKPPPGRNWCAFVKSKLSTVVVSCGVERYAQRTTEPCMNGMVNCQNGVYQLALRPLYKVKQMIVTSLEWKCCPGYIGSRCEHTVPEELTAPASLKQALGGEQVIEELINPREPVTSIDDLQGSESKLHHLQDDVSVTTASTQAFQELLNNLTKINPSMENKENRTEFPALQDILKPHVENYLRQHLHSLWTTFNKSLQHLSDMVLNLSQDIEVNRKNINELSKQRIPQRELEEISTKLQSKLDENIEQLQKVEDILNDQQHKLNYELHAQKVNLDHNLTMIKTETDLKVKRSQKMIQMKSHLLENTTAEMMKEQDRLWQEVDTLNDRLAKIIELNGSKSCSSCDSKTVHQVKGMSKQDFDQLRETVEVHSRNFTHLNRICGLFHPASKAISDFQQQLKRQESNCAQLVAGLKTDMNQKLNETNMSFTENILRLNVSFNHQSSSHEERLYNLDGDVKELKQKLYRMADDQVCGCQKLIVDYGLVVDNLRNASTFMDKMYFDLNDVKQQELDLRINLNYSVQDLFRSSQQRHQDVQNLLFLQQEEINTLTEDITTLQKNSTMIMREIKHLKKLDATMDSHIKYLNSSFSSLLEDALRHTVILQSVTGQDILEITSDGATELQKLSISALYQNLNETENDLVTHKIILENINKRVQVLEEGRSNDKIRESSGLDYGENVLKDNSSEIDDRDHLFLEHMEANFEALEKEQMDDSKYDSNEISNIKKDIEMLNLKVIKLESHCNNEDPYYNQSLEQIKELFTKSVETVQSDVSSLKQFLDSHISVFQKLTGSVHNLSNGTFRVGRGSFGSKRMKKQHRQSHHGSKHLEIYGNASIAVSQSSIPNAQEFQVAFYVGLSNNSGTNMILKFDQIFLNYGDGYSMEKGYFKAPFKGIYVFVVTVEFGHGSGLSYLSVDGNHTITLHNSRKRHQHNSLVWGYAILQLSKGQHVWVEVTQGVVIQQTPPETTFGGFLLFKTF
ncbi:multimerin-2a [Carcharodon carcharias]|uniref:multimerin-2a n=1 Tax=Carcharodon carcharias TaxID=13397 RepID=UPI001B7F47C2|nr:multimerin-2a [Carcharodon carcharias]